MPKIDSTAKLTSKSHLTPPVAVLKALSVGPDDELVFTIHEGGTLEDTKAHDTEANPDVLSCTCTPLPVSVKNLAGRFLTLAHTHFL